MTPVLSACTPQGHACTSVKGLSVWLLQPHVSTDARGGNPDQDQVLAVTVRMSHHQAQFPDADPEPIHLDVSGEQQVGTGFETTSLTQLLRAQLTSRLPPERLPRSEASPVVGNASLGTCTCRSQITDV